MCNAGIFGVLLLKTKTASMGREAVTAAMTVAMTAAMTAAAASVASSAVSFCDVGPW